jgi:hypothetical protein
MHYVINRIITYRGYCQEGVQNRGQDLMGVMLESNSKGFAYQMYLPPWTPAGKTDKSRWPALSR